MHSYAAFLRDAHRPRPTIVAHRGAWAEAPENSVAAIEAAGAAGFEIVEIDVRRAKDGQLHIFHDKTCARMTGHGQAIEEMTSAEVAALRLFASDGTTQETTEHRIPTLEQALEAARGRLYLDLDVKHAEDLAETATAARQMGLAAQVDIKIKVAGLEDVATLKGLHETHGLVVMPMTRFTTDTWPSDCALVEATAAPMVETKFDTLATLRNVAARLAKSGIAVWVNTLPNVTLPEFSDDRAVTEPDAVWGALSQAGVSIFQTDIPETLHQWRKA